MRRAVIGDVDLRRTHVKRLQSRASAVRPRGYPPADRSSDDPMDFPFQRMRDPALPESGAQTPKPLSKHVLRRGDVLHGGLRRYRAGHLAFAALHGHHDLRGAHSATNTGMYTHRHTLAYVCVCVLTGIYA